MGLPITAERGLQRRGLLTFAPGSVKALLVAAITSILVKHAFMSCRKTFAEKETWGNQDTRIAVQGR